MPKCITYTFEAGKAAASNARVQPTLLEYILVETTGIVLINEADLYLHTKEPHTVGKFDT